MAFLSYSADQLATNAARDLGVIRSGQPLPTDLLTDCFTVLNEMIDSFLIDDTLVYAYRSDIYPLVGLQQVYTIGPTGPVDFVAQRPTEIQEANVILNYVYPVVRQPIEIINVDQWAAIRVRDIQSAIPQKLYYDANFSPTQGYATINLWPGPISAYQLELFTWQQLTSFPDQTTAIYFPPAYAGFVRDAFALRIVPLMVLYQKTNQHVSSPFEITVPIIEKRMNLALKKIREYNAKTPILTLDPSFTTNAGTDWNYALGTTGTKR
jgi:hypothetical protein